MRPTRDIRNHVSRSIRDPYNLGSDYANTELRNRYPDCVTESLLPGKRELYYQTRIVLHFLGLRSQFLSNAFIP